MFQYWGPGEWAFSIWVIGYLITFLIYLFVCKGKNEPETMNLASLLIMFIWPLILFYWSILLAKQAEE